MTNVTPNPARYNPRPRLQAAQKPPGTAQANPLKLLGLAALAIGLIGLGFLAEAAFQRAFHREGPKSESVATNSAVAPFGVSEWPSNYGEVQQAAAAAEQEQRTVEAAEPAHDQDIAPPPPDPALEAARRLREEAIRSPLVVARNARTSAAAPLAATATGALPVLGNQAAAGDAANYAATAPDTDRQNLQAEKLAFLGSGSYDDVVLNRPYLPPADQHLLLAGTSIPAALITGINSDLPGDIIAQVTEPVFDSLTGNHVLVPAGARLIGRYDSLIAFGQDRALLVWDRLIMPNGYSIQLDQFNGTDAAGRAGVADQVDFHYRRLAIGVLVSALISTGAQVARGDRDEGDIRREIGDSIATDVNRTSRSIIERYLGVQPTITIRPGWPVRVSVNRDVRLTPYARLPG